MTAPALQQALKTAFAKREGCAIVLRRDTGATVAAWRPDLCKSWSFAPGSAVKPFVLEALLPLHPPPLPCLRTLTLDGTRLDCTHPPFAAPLRARDALAVSCNSWFARQALRLSPVDLAKSLSMHRMEARTPRDITELQLLALGVGGLRVTTAVLARAYLRLAAKPSGEVLAGLLDAVRSGTAQHAGRDVGGKTGTTREAACFAGFNDAIVVAVALPGGTGGGDAAPVAGEVFRAWRALP